MTLVIALKATDGIVVGSDSRSSVVPPKSQGLQFADDGQEKFFALGRSCAIGIAGIAGIGKQLIETVAPSLRRLADPEQVAKRAGEMFLEESLRWMNSGSGPPGSAGDGQAGEATTRLEALQLAFIITGCGSSGPRIFQLRPQFGFMPEAQDSRAMIGMPTVAEYLYNRLYAQGMDVQRALRFTALMLSESSQVIPAVGGPLRLASLTRANGYNRLAQGEVDAIQSAVEKRIERFRASLQR